jgi:hypothetical protein
MEIRAEFTRKDINFIDDIALREILHERLNELDKISLVRGNYSTIFLAISTIEGMFKHVATMFKAEIMQSSNYPVNEQGNRKQFRDLSIDELCRLLKERDILPDIPKFEEIYNLFRSYRNFVHPQAQKKKAWPVDLGHAQIALGLLNATIDNLAEYIFIEKEKFKRIEGNPDYFNRVLSLIVHRTRLHSFLVLDREISSTLSLNFDLELTKDSLFNFVFNFTDDGNFKMLRLDNRKIYRNCVLQCTQKYLWKPILFADQGNPPEKALFAVEINIDFQKKMFSLGVDGDVYSFKDSNGNVKNLFDELKPNLKIGFFNEVGTVKLWNIVLSIG